MPFPTITICLWQSDAFTNKSLKQIMGFNNCWFNDQKIHPDEYFERFSSFYFGDCLHFNSGQKTFLVIQFQFLTNLQPTLDYLLNL
jgi:hypothetical protein